MEFLSEEEAKTYSISLTAGYSSPEKLNETVTSYRSYIKSASNTEDKQYWQDELQKLEELISSTKYKNGDYSQGIDQLFLELIEWRASIYAFQKVDTKQSPFTEHAFYAQWLMGGTYTVFCIIGKLVSKDKRDNSLTKLWSETYPYISNSELCSIDEINTLLKRMHRTEGQFSNTNSQSILYRNKVIAHNESMPNIEWTEIDKDIKLICRIWALITMWSSFGIFNPYRDSSQVFSGLESVFSHEEMKQLQQQRKNYINLVKKWCTHNIINGEKTSERSPFAELSISINVKHGK